MGTMTDGQTMIVVVAVITVGALCIPILKDLIVGLCGWTRQKARVLIRRLLDTKQFETLILDELKENRQNIHSLSMMLPTREHLNKIELLQLEMGRSLAAHHSRLNSLKREVEEMGIHMRSYTDTLGPIWTTAAGHAMPLRLLSTEHLRNIRKGGFTRSPRIQTFIDLELERRRIDGEMREAQAAGARMPTKADYEMASAKRMQAELDRITGLQHPSPSVLGEVLDGDTVRRVRQVLPMWAQDLIQDLSLGRSTELTDAEGDRMEVLPFWAIDLIDDLIQRARK